MNENGLYTISDIIIFGNQDPDHNAIECPGYLPLTYRDLREQIISVVKTLNSRGFHRNDRIAVITPAGPETAVAIVSVMAGFTAVSLNPQNKAGEFSRDFLQLNIKAIIVQKGYETAATAMAKSHNIPVIELIPVFGMAGKFKLEPAAAVRDTTEPEFATPSDIAILALTSGTTAAPKIVAFSQKRLCAGAHASVSRYQYNDSDRHLHIVPYYHMMGISGTIINPWLSHGTVICTKDFIPSDFPYLLRTYRPTQYIAAPAMHQGILRALKKVSTDELKNNSLRFIRSSSASLNEEVKFELERLLGVAVTENYGMSEAGTISVNIPPRKGSVGIQVIDNLAIIEENGTPLSPGETGEIVVKGRTVFSGYENAPEENENAFLNGWFRTGDMGYLDDDGYLFLTGRKKEMINKGGRKIAPVEIDTVLLSHPGVRDAMAFRIPDPVLGEDIAAMVVKKDNLVSEEDLRRYCLDRLIQFKVPQRIYFTEEIPKNALGKPLRDEGTVKFGDAPLPTAELKEKNGQENLPGPTTTDESLLRLWKGILELPDISPDDDFFLCGGNSLTAIELLIKIQREFHVSLPPDTIYRYPTIKEQTVLLQKKVVTAKEYHPLIFPLREGGTLPPLFCIHPLGGWMDHYLMILSAIDSARPVFGIRGRGLEPGEVLPKTVEATAKEQVDAIRTVQNREPYHLLGFSNGGIIAFEMACQLQESGEDVAFLGIIDVTAPATEVRYIKTLAATLFPGRILGTIPAFFERLLKAHPESALSVYIQKTIRTVFHKVLFRSRAKALPESVSGVHASVHFKEDTLARFPEESRPNMRVQLNASRMYLPHTFAGDIVLFSTGQDPILFPGDMTRGWGSIITGKCEVIAVPGDHSNLFDEPQLSVLLKKIRDSFGAGR